MPIYISLYLVWINMNILPFSDSSWRIRVSAIAHFLRILIPFIDFQRFFPKTSIFFFFGVNMSKPSNCKKKSSSEHTKTIHFYWLKQSIICRLLLDYSYRSNILANVRFSLSRWALIWCWQIATLFLAALFSGSNSNTLEKSFFAEKIERQSV